MNRFELFKLENDPEPMLNIVNSIVFASKAIYSLFAIVPMNKPKVEPAKFSNIIVEIQSKKLEKELSFTLYTKKVTTVIIVGYINKIKLEQM